MAASVELLRSIRRLGPVEKMFDDALVELMENVGRDGKEDVRVRQVFPKRMEKRLDTCCATCFCESARTVVDGGQGVEDVLEVTDGSRWLWRGTNFVARDSALWTLPSLAASHKDLLWVVTNIWAKTVDDTSVVSITKADYIRCCHVWSKSFENVA